MSVVAPPPVTPPELDELEALIREARARQRRRRVLTVAAVAVASALAIAIRGAVAGRVMGPSAGRSGAIAGGPCSMASLAVRLIPISNPTGLDRLGLQFTNRASSSCSLDGYPVLRFRDAEGAIPFLIRRLGKPHERTLGADRSIFSIFSKFRCDIGVARSATRTLVALPGDAGGSVSFPGGPAICKPGIPAEGRWITVTPFEPLRTAYRDSLVGDGSGP